MVPLSKQYFGILVSNHSPFDLVHWIRYYPLSPQDHNRLINIDCLLKALIPNTKQTIQPQKLLAQCKTHAIIAPNIPELLVVVVEQLGPHLSLNLPSVFNSLELNPDIFINLAKIKKNKEKVQVAALPEDKHSLPLPIPSKPTETPLSFSKRLYPLKHPERWKGADGLSLNEIVLLHYGIDPEGIYQLHLPGESIDERAKELDEYLNRHFHGDRQWLISQIDEKKVVDLLRRSILVGNIKVSDQGIFSMTDIVEWMRSKNLSFPIQGAKDHETTQPDLELDLKQTILAYDMGRFRPEQQARLICRIVATSIWKTDQKLNLQKMQKHPLFKQAASMAQEIMHKSDAIEPKTVEDWIRDLNPSYNPKK